MGKERASGQKTAQRKHQGYEGFWLKQLDRTSAEGRPRYER
jgi:hypothetical protein